MSGVRPAVVLASVALAAALLGHVIIDILGDYLLAHDTYDDLNHASRSLVALVTFALLLAGAVGGVRAAIREARGSDDALCLAIRRALPTHALGFILLTVVAAAVALCAMESCDTLLAGHPVDDLGDLFGGSVTLGASVITVVASVTGFVALALLHRLARAATIAGIVVAFLRRYLPGPVDIAAEFAPSHRLLYAILRICRRIAGRAPPPLPLVATS